MILCIIQNNSSSFLFLSLGHARGMSLSFEYFSGSCRSRSTISRAPSVTDYLMNKHIKVTYSICLSRYLAKPPYWKRNANRAILGLTRAQLSNLRNRAIVSMSNESANS